jgi:Bacterial Ig-like domain (group 3)/FG-GAP-like repeat
MKQATRAEIQTQGPRSLRASLGLRTFGDTQQFRHRKSLISFMRAAALIASLCVSASVVRGGPQTHTTTTLAVAPGASVAAGIPVTLTATVTFTSSVTSGPVTAGTVVFCNANAVHCEDAAIIATAQLTNTGTATIKVTLGVGTYSIFAAYKADLFPASKSSNEALTVTADADYFSFTSITASAPPSPYTLTGTVAAFGTAPPTGTVTFFDVTSSTVVGAGVLDPATLGFTFVPASGSPVAVGFDPEVAILGDFNNDGKLDLAVAVGVQTPGANTVSVLLGNGDGTFQPKASYAPANFFAAWILAGDFNHDGNLDLAVVISGDGVEGDGTGTVNILLGNGDGTFQPQQTYIVGNRPDSIAMADFNGDGFLDLAVLNSADDNVTVLLGNGDGTFVLEQSCAAEFVPGTHTEGTPTCVTATFPVGNDAVQIATADFNADGKADLVVTNSESGTVSVLLGVGDGTFQSQVTYTVGREVDGIAVADFNGDGIPDLAVTNEADNTVGVLLGIGDGTFQQPQVTYATGLAPLGISVGDFKGNGNADLAVSNVESNTVSVFFNKGDGTGTFQPQVTFPGGGLPLQLVAGDLNGDGLSDLAIVNARQFTGNIFKATILLAAQTETATAAGVVISGTQNVMATYPGDTIRADSQSATIPVGPVATMTSLSCSPNPAFSGQLVTCTATVAPIPTGTDNVDFFNGATSLGIADINSSGVATFTTSSLPLGPSSITAVFSGSAGFATSTSSAVIVNVNAQTVTTTTLVVTPNPAVAGQPVTFTATVTPAPTGAPLGTVSFSNGATLLGSGTVNSSGVATFTTSSLPAGVLSLTATFSSNAGFAGSTSTTQSVTVSAQTVATTTTLSVAPNPATAGQTVTLTATVTPAPTGTPAGSVSFKKGVTLLGTGTVNSSGVATFTTSGLPVGTYGLMASYPGNAGFAASVSSVQSVTVNASAVPTTIMLTSAPNPATAGQPVTFTATVAPTPTGTPLGTVNFFNGATLLGMASLNSAGVATFTISSLPSGTDVITAVFSGNAGSAGSTSTPVDLVINSTFAVTAPTAPITVAAGGMVNINIGVAPVGSSFTNVVTMSATGLPAGATATFNPPSVTPGAAGATTVLRVAFSASAQLAPEPGRNQPFALFGFAAAGLGLFIRKRKRLARSWTMALACAALMCGLLLTPGCGTTGSGAKSQTIVVTVTGTSASAHESAMITLILK